MSLPIYPFPVAYSLIKDPTIKETRPKHINKSSLNHKKRKKLTKRCRFLMSSESISKISSISTSTASVCNETNETNKDLTF